jgi:hypothetical protein
MVVFRTQESQHGLHHVSSQLPCRSRPVPTRDEGGSGYAATMPRNWRLSSVLVIFLAGFSQSPTDRPSLSDAQAWFHACRTWLDAQDGTQRETPSKSLISEPAGSAAEMRFSAVGVILRLDGRLVGEAWRRGPGTAAIEGALSEAFGESRADRRIAALPAELRAQLGSRLALELEFAGEPQPLVGDRLDLMAARIEPALDAFAIRNGDRWVFALPCSIQTHSQSAFMNYLALTLARDVGLDPAASKDLKLPDGAAAYRCATRRLAQRTANAPPFESIRGRQVVPVSSVDGARVQRMATELAAHLAQRWPSMDGLPAESVDALRALGPRALYQPAKNAWPEPVSPPADQALAALALAEFSNSAWAGAEDRAQARGNAIATLESLRRVRDGETDPVSDASACAAAWLAAAALDRSDAAWADEGMRIWVRGIADSLRTGPASTSKPSPTTAAMAWAVLGESMPEAWRTIAWDPAVPERVVTATPWIAPASRVPALDIAAAWTRTLPPLMDSQFVARIDGASADDLDGGWPAGSQSPWPQAQSARAALGLATALQRKEWIDPNARAKAIECLRQAMRFLVQLQADEDACHAFRDPARARGGIRTSCWDSEQPIAASAYALLAAVRAADALDGSPTPAP